METKREDNDALDSKAIPNIIKDGKDPSSIPEAPKKKLLSLKDIPEKTLKDIPEKTLKDIPEKVVKKVAKKVIKKVPKKVVEKPIKKAIKKAVKRVQPKKKDPNKSKAALGLKKSQKKKPFIKGTFEKHRTEAHEKRNMLGTRGASPSSYCDELLLEKKWTHNQIIEKIKKKYPTSNFVKPWIVSRAWHMLKSGKIKSKLVRIKELIKAKKK